MARYEGWLGNYPIHVSFPHKQAEPKKLIMAVSFVLTLEGFPLTQLSSIWEFRNLSIRSGQACPDFPTILQGLTRKPSRTSAVTGHTESLIREIQINLIDQAELKSM